jgi:ParB/RepB/Spo0J family partition protein
MKKATTESTPEICPVQLVAVKSIDPSPANKRRIINEKSLCGLADSIEAQGLLQTIVLRKSPAKKGRFELVAGERRWRAFVLKGWKNIPSIVRELSDKEAHDITTIENLQREDLSPIEEAESIQVLLDDGRDAKEIADRIGKPVSWVLRRARIAELSPKWLKAIADPKHPLSKWSATHLELIARFDQTRQDELFEEYGNKWDGRNVLLTVKELEKALNGTIFALSAAPWKLSDETVLPAAGACTTCQKRTSCAPSLFEPIEDTKATKGDRCLDRECWGKKLVAFHKIGITRALEENKNLILVDKGGSALPLDHPWKKSLVEYWKYEKAKQGDRKAVPAYVVGGAGAGKVEYLKIQKHYEKSHEGRPVCKDGKPAPKSLEERKEGLEKRRTIRFINKLMLILRGEDPDATGAMSGVCRVCGCTEENCTQCMEKTGNPCHWVDEEKTLCSACADNEKKEDRRVKITDDISHIEIYALVAAFGAAPKDHEFHGFPEEGNEGEIDKDENYESDFDRWNVYEKIVMMNGSDAIQTAAYCVFDRIVDQLRQLTYASEPDFEFANNLCTALKLDRDAIWNKVLEEIPEPKGWANLNADGKLKKVTTKKKKSISDLIEGVPIDESALPATRYNYQEHEIFVSAGLGGKEFGTFRMSNGGSGLKRIVSKKMPMVADRNEAQQNLDKFAKDNRLEEMDSKE